MTNADATAARVEPSPSSESAAASRVLVAATEPIIAEIAPACLQFAGYDTHLCRTGAHVLATRQHLLPNVVVLDTQLPDMDGFTLASQLRRQDDRTPILFLTSLGELHGQRAGLTVGADDYLVKPFSLDEMTARVRAALRRGGTGRGARYSEDAILRFADLEFDEDTQEIRRGGHSIRLAPREREILRYLLVNAGRTVTRKHIVDHVWPYNHTGDARALDVHICLLRRKLDRHGPPLIHTVHGVGYRLRPPDNAANAGQGA